MRCLVNFIKRVGKAGFSSVFVVHMIHETMSEVKQRKLLHSSYS